MRWDGKGPWIWPEGSRYNHWVSGVMWGIATGGLKGAAGISWAGTGGCGGATWWWRVCMNPSNAVEEALKLSSNPPSRILELPAARNIPFSSNVPKSDVPKVSFEGVAHKFSGSSIESSSMRWFPYPPRSWKSLERGLFEVETKLPPRERFSPWCDWCCWRGPPRGLLRYSPLPVVWE